MIAIGTEVYKVEGSTIIKGIVENVVRSNFVLGTYTISITNSKQEKHYCTVDIDSNKDDYINWWTTREKAVQYQIDKLNKLIPKLQNNLIVLQNIKDLLERNKQNELETN